MVSDDEQRSPTRVGVVRIVELVGSSLAVGGVAEGWSEQGAEASAGASVGEVDGARGQGWRVSISSSSPAGIVSPFFSCAVLPIVCARLLAAVGRAIALVRQDDSAVLID